MAQESEILMVAPTQVPVMALYADDEGRLFSRPVILWQLTRVKGKTGDRSVSACALDDDGVLVDISTIKGFQGMVPDPRWLAPEELAEEGVEEDGGITEVEGDIGEGEEESTDSTDSGE